MGGDAAPDVAVKGGILAERDFPEIELIYVGDQKRLEALYAQHQGPKSHPHIVHASQTVDMGDTPLGAIRDKPDNSISKAVQLHKEGKAQAFVSAGNTGACVAAATLTLRMLEGIQRPGIACSFPSAKGTCLVLDCGANVNARPRHLLDYAVLGKAFRKYVQGKDQVRVGLLNIGEEDAKGNDFTKECFELLSKHRDRLNFIGNVESRDIFRGDVDVVLCEGFVGNTLLKGAEGLAKMLMGGIKGVLTNSLKTKMAALLLRKELRGFAAGFDPNLVGGAPLLGVNGHVVISHGSSTYIGIRNAVRTARDMISGDLNANIQKML